MPIRRGCPFDASEINDLVATHYPDYHAQLPAIPAGGPIMLNNILFDGDFAKRTFLAMICPPNMSLRTPTLFGLPLGAVGTLSGVSNDFGGGWPLEAPDVFVDFTSALYVGTTGGVNEMNAAYADYKAGNQDVRVLGTLTSSYGDGFNNAAAMKLCGKQLPP